MQSFEKSGRRDFLKKIGILAAGAALPGFLGASEKKQENSENKNQELIKELFEKREILPNPGKNFSERTDLWYKRYSGRDPEFDELELIYKKRLNGERKKKNLPEIPEISICEELDEAWQRLVSSGDLQTVHRIAKEKEVPFDLLFLGITESHWKTGVKSRAGAAGPWQFMKATAKEWGLKVNDKVDERLDVEKSTEAACKFLKSLHQKTGAIKNVAESDRWIWAFWAYNRGPGHIFGIKNGKTGKVVKQGDFFRTKGQVENYFSVCPNRESKNYTPKIFGVAKALEEKFYDKNAPAPLPEEKPERSPADRLFLSYADQNFLTDTAKIEYLNAVIDKYEEEAGRGAHSSEYVESAIDEAFKEIDKIVEKPPAEEIGEEEKEGISTVVYKMRAGDNLNKISVWLAGPAGSEKAKNLIKELNPRVKNWNRLRVGQEIVLPGDLLPVPSVPLEEILKEYYPGIDPDVSIKYLKWLNGKNPATEKIKPGEMIKVPLKE